MSRPEKVPRRYHVGNFLARIALQPFWQRLNDLSYWGLGYNNWISRLNGEDRFSTEWASGRTGRPSVVFDVGANEGDFTGHILPLLPSGRFHLFEPNPTTFSRLRARYENCENVTLNECGVGREASTIELFDFAEGSGSERASFLPDTFSVMLGVKNARGSRVEVTTIDDYVSRHKISHIDFLKIDVEGFERFVIEGAARSIETGMIDTIQLESNEHSLMTGFNLYQITRMLPNYDIYRLLPRGLAPVVTAKNSYNARADTARYCNLVLFRRGAGMSQS